MVLGPEGMGELKDSMAVKCELVMHLTHYTIICVYFIHEYQFTKVIIMHCCIPLLKPLISVTPGSDNTLTFLPTIPYH